MSMMCGGATDLMEADEEVQKICDSIKNALEKKAGRNFTEFTAKQYRTQLVAGTNFFIKIHIGENKFVHARIWRQLSGELEISNSKIDLSSDEELVYF